MKYLILLLILLFAEKLPAQKNGYYVTVANDTVPAFIHLRKDVFGPYSLSGIHKEVRISSDSSAEEKIFKPGQIKSFLVRTAKGEFSFHSKPASEKDTLFLQEVVATPLTSLYSYRQVRVGGKLGTSEAIHYTIEKPDRNYLFVFNRNHTKLKKRLREFYAGNDKILQVVEPLFKQPGFVDRDLAVMFNRLREVE